MDGDGKMDMLLGGNFYESKPEAGIYDASHGLVLKGDGNGNFISLKAEQSGVNINGAVRDIIAIDTKKGELMIIARNNEAAVLLEKKKNSNR